MGFNIIGMILIHKSWKIVYEYLTNIDDRVIIWVTKEDYVFCKREP